MNRPAEDRYEIYFAEKLWEMIPAIYRHEDGLANNPGVLRGLIEVMANQAALLRRSQDSLWDDQFIELCNDWAVPYIADLLGTRMVSAQNKRGRRIDVAKTIYYRRRKGTLRILEELISDLTTWDGKVVENFKRLGRNRHGLDPHPASLAGQLSGTMPGGWADLRQASASELADGPFDEYAHFADTRQHHGHKGRYGIPKLAFHLYRLKAYMVSEVTPFDSGDGLGFTFDPSGRDIPLFVRRDRPDERDKWHSQTDRLNALFAPRNQSSSWDQWYSALEWQLPGPIRCRLLGHEEYEIGDEIIPELVNSLSLSPAAATELRQLANQRFRNRARLRTSLEAMANSAEINPAAPFFTPEVILEAALINDCGKNALLKGGDADESSLYVDINVPGGRVSVQQIQAGQLENWANNALPQTRLIIDPERGRFRLVGIAPGDEIAVMYHYGFSGEFGAGTFKRQEVETCEPTWPLISGGGVISAADYNGNAVNQINDSMTYERISNKRNIQNMTLQAANGERPYIRLTKDWRLRALSDREDAQLTLDGLWIGGVNTVVNPGQKAIVLRGDYECVVISHCTIDPGGFIDSAGQIEVDASGREILPVPLIIEATIENLFIVSSITGPIFTRGNGAVERLTINDSIIHSVDNAQAALQLNTGEIIMNRVTVFGHIDIHRLQASEVMLSGISNVLDTQNSCFRFSAAPAASRLPRPYESFLFTQDTNHWFSSRKFGQPGYGQLSDTAPVALQRGAENGSEIGAFSSLINPIKLDSLKVKVEEYMPFGLIPIFINET